MKGVILLVGGFFGTLLFLSGCQIITNHYMNKYHPRAEFVDTRHRIEIPIPKADPRHKRP